MGFLVFEDLDDCVDGVFLAADVVVGGDDEFCFAEVEVRAMVGDYAIGF